jgi:hypothetical protein
MAVNTRDEARVAKKQKLAGGEAFAFIAEGFLSPSACEAFLLCSHLCLLCFLLLI